MAIWTSDPSAQDWPGRAVFEPGTVWLVGAGPGDPGLLTLHAVSALGQADVVVYDALVGEGCLRLARPGAVLEFAGKRGGRLSHTQDGITMRLVELARAGKRVLRLKGGDPFVFGRGAEEALGLVAAGVRFRIVPGITAGIGGLAYAGIPVTHRDSNQAVTFVTGHTAAGGMPDDVDWGALAKGGQALVFFMAKGNWPRIAERLLAGGRSEAEPAAIVVEATLPSQRVIVTSLGAAHAELADGAIDGPAMIVVGEIARLAERLAWFGGGAGEDGALSRFA